MEPSNRKTLCSQDVSDYHSPVAYIHAYKPERALLSPYLRKKLLENLSSDVRKKCLGISPQGQCNK